MMPEFGIAENIAESTIAGAKLGRTCPDMAPSLVVARAAGREHRLSFLA
jgi:hypothetical protein